MDLAIVGGVVFSILETVWLGVFVLFACFDRARNSVPWYRAWSSTKSLHQRVVNTGHRDMESSILDILIIMF